MYGCRESISRKRDCSPAWDAMNEKSRRKRVRALCTLVLGVKLQLDGILFFSRHEILFWLIVTTRSENHETSQAMRGKNPKFQLLFLVPTNDRRLKISTTAQFPFHFPYKTKNNCIQDEVLPRRRPSLRQCFGIHHHGPPKRKRCRFHRFDRHGPCLHRIVSLFVCRGRLNSLLR